MDTPNKWFTLKTLWRSFDVTLSNETLTPDLANRFGLTDIDAGIIWLDAKLPRQALIATLIHEAMHAVMATPGESLLLARILGCSEEDADAREEDIVTHLAPKLADALLRSGLLRFPRQP